MERCFFMPEKTRFYQLFSKNAQNVPGGQNVLLDVRNILAASEFSGS